METVGTDRAPQELNVGDGPRPRVEPDLGLAVWRRHINLGLISHTQSSRIWRQASQVGLVPLMRHITERVGTGDAPSSRTWDSLPFVMVRRMPMVQARTILATGSTADHQSQREVHGLADAPGSEPDASPAIALDSKGSDGPASASPIGTQREAQWVTSDHLPIVQRSLTNMHDRSEMPEAIGVPGPSQVSELSTASPMSIQREAQPAESERFPLVQRSTAGMHDGHQGVGPEVAEVSDTSQGSEPSTASPIGIQREAHPVTSEPLPLVQRSALGMHESYGVSDAAGSLPESPLSTTPSSAFAPTSGLSIDAAPSSPILRRVIRSNASSVSPGDATMGEATHRISLGKIPEGLVTEGATQGLASISGQDLTLFRHPLARDAGAPSSLVLQAPIIRRALKRDAPTVSDQSGTDARPEGPVCKQLSGHGASNSDFPFVQPLPLVHKYPDGAVSNGDPGVAHDPSQTSILRMGQMGTLDTQPMSISSVRHESSAAVPIILRSVRPTIRRMSHVEAAHEPEWNDIQRQKNLPIPAKGAVSSPSPLLPLIQRAERPLTGSNSSTLIWRSPVAGVTTGAPSPDGFSNYEPDAGPISRNLLPFIARQTMNPAGLHVPRPGIPPMDDLPALTGSRGASTSVNPAEVAEQVSRLLTRQLAVERERRGVRS